MKTTEQIIEALNPVVYHNHDSHECAIIVAAQAELERLAKLEAASKWIPVTERMPDTEAEVLCFCNQSYCSWQTIARLHDGKWWGRDAIDVTHWMPLPAAPGSAADAGGGGGSK